jgi:hypothetical protein
MADAELQREHEKGADAARRHRLRRSIWREWQAAGYTRRQHLTGLAAVGDPFVLVEFREDEARCRVTPRPFSTWLAAQDMWEIEQGLRN